MASNLSIINSHLRMDIRTSYFTVVVSRVLQGGGMRGDENQCLRYLDISIRRIRAPGFHSRLQPFRKIKNDFEGKTSLETIKRSS